MTLETPVSSTDAVSSLFSCKGASAGPEGLAGSRLRRRPLPVGSGRLRNRWGIALLARANKNRPAAQAGRNGSGRLLWRLVVVACYGGSPLVLVPVWPEHGVGGAEEIRTPDLRRAKAALSQLSYGPSGGLCKCACTALKRTIVAQQWDQDGGGPFWTRTRDLSLIRTAL